MRPANPGAETFAGVLRMIATGFVESMRSGRELANTSTAPASGEDRKLIVYSAGLTRSQLAFSIPWTASELRAGNADAAIATIPIAATSCVGQCKRIDIFPFLASIAPISIATPYLALELVQRRPIETVRP